MGAERRGGGLSSWHLWLATCHADSPGLEGSGCVGRAGKPQFLPSAFILPSLVSSRFSSGSPVYFHQPELAVFYVVLRDCFFY